MNEFISFNEIREIAGRHPEHQRLQQLMSQPSWELSSGELDELLKIAGSIKISEKAKKNARKQFFETIGGIAFVLFGLLVFLSYLVRFL
jgi:uncharacterized protein YjgD (DUF1641 family)